jgi:hypothetical protein
MKVPEAEREENQSKNFLFDQTVSTAHKSMSSVVKSVVEHLPGPLRNDADALVVAIHACFESEGFEFVGVDDSLDHSKKLSKLPETWNQSEDFYGLFYRHASLSGVYEVKCLTMDDTLILHAAMVGSENVNILELR